MHADMAICTYLRFFMLYSSARLRDRLLRYWLLFAALALYLALAAPQLDLPGLHYDEALEAAAPAALLLNGQSVAIVNNGALRWGDLRLPLMVQNHIGAVQVYAAMPFVALLGPTTVALRTMTVLVGGVTLAAMYMFVAQVYGRTAAGAAALWLAAFPSFVFWSRQGVFVTNLAPCFAACAFASGARWWRVRGVGMAAATGLLAGLAVWSKLSALWLVNGTLVWAALVALAGSRQPTTDNRRWQWQWLATLGGFLLGILPVILYNLLTGFATFRAVGGSAATTYLGTSNLDVLANLATRFGQFADVLASGAHLWYLGGPFPNRWALLSVLAALAVIGCALVLRRGRGWQRMLFMPTLVLACIAQSCFTISALWPTHFAIAVWLPAVIVGMAVGTFGNGRPTTDHRPPTTDGAPNRAGFRVQGSGVGVRWSVVSSRLAWATLLLIVATQALTSRAYLDAERVTGGFAFHSTAIADVSRFLATRPEPVVALDWGIAAPIEYLTDGTKRVEEFYGFTPAAPANFAAALRQRFGHGELYVTHAQYQEAFQRRQAFLDAVKAAGLRAETVNVSIRKDGWPMIEVWRVIGG